MLLQGVGVSSVCGGTEPTALGEGLSSPHTENLVGLPPGNAIIMLWLSAIDLLSEPFPVNGLEERPELL